MAEKRAIVIVLDSVGCGALPDAEKFGDAGTNTLVHISERCGLKLPNLAALGLGNIVAIPSVPPAEEPRAAYGKAAEVSAGKDTTTGHWEIAGVVKTTDWPYYPEGFPPEILVPFIAETGVPGVLCNQPYSGTVVINEFGDEHVETRKPIVYTSADSVFQIACHEEICPPEELYRLCRVARKILTGSNEVARVIARPFVGKGNGNYRRTANRRDFSIAPIGPTMLDVISGAGREVIAIGKIGDIYEHRGVTREIHTEDNADGMAQTLDAIKTADVAGLIMVNLVDFDVHFGHRRDPVGYRDALQAFDDWLPTCLEALREGDLLIITADHGNDPTHTGTDHTREHVPIIAFGPAYRADVNIGKRETYADIAQTVLEHVGVGKDGVANGQSFLSALSS